MSTDYPKEIYVNPESFEYASLWQYSLDDETNTKIKYIHIDEVKEREEKLMKVVSIYENCDKETIDSFYNIAGLEKLK